MRKISFLLVFLLVPIFSAQAENKPGAVNWEEIFSAEGMAGFWTSFFFVFKLFLPYLIGLIIIRIILGILKKKLKKKKD